MMNWQIVESDIIKWAASYNGSPFHSIFCDPPYHLTSINKRFGKNGSAPAQFGKDGAFQRSSTGFMGQQWDGGDIAFRPETWAALAEHLYPGGFGMAFASSRGQHRMACAIEDAGLIIHPTIGWCFSTGFPKATRIKAPLHSLRWRWLDRLANRYLRKIGRLPQYGLPDIWETHRYGGQIQKPALEFIIVFQKPYEGRPIDNITETGAGALNVDGGRIDIDSSVDDKQLGGKGQWNIKRKQSNYTVSLPPMTMGSDQQGRWPANLILDDSEAVRAMFPETKSGKLEVHYIRTQDKKVNVYGNWADGKGSTFEGAPSYGDSGSAARFFYQTNWNYEVYEALAQADPIKYCSKPTRKERDAGLDDLPLLTRNRIRPGGGGLANEERWAPVEARNIHPTVKPISLCKYLATLLLPPDEYAPRRIAVPFCGSGSDMIGAMLAGWEEIVGVDMSPEYCQITEARLAWWADFIKDGQTDIDKILGAIEEEKVKKESGQGRLF